jgi:outer membrane protein TolC
MPGFDRLQLAHTVNPAFNGGVRPSTVDTRIERSISVNLMTWVSVSALASESAELRSRRVQAADELVAMLFVARRSWVYAIAARQSVFYLADVAAAAEAGRDIMENMRQIGNSTELEFLRAQAVYADTVANLTAAQAAAAIERERLVQAMGLWGEEADRVQLPQRLPDLPITAVGPEGLEARAVSQRFDVRVGRLEGSAGEAGVNARADVRSAWLAYRGEYDLAKHAQEAIVPLARRVSEEQLKLYNGMLVGVMDLISDATERTNAVSAALNSQRNFWLAEIELQRAMSGVGVSAVAPPNGTNTLSSEVVSHAD